MRSEALPQGLHLVGVALGHQLLVVQVVRLREREEVLLVHPGVQPGLHEHGRERVRLVGLHVVLGPLEQAGLRVLRHGEGAAVHLHAALVDLLREDAVRGVHEDDGAVLLEAVDLVVVDLQLAQLLAQSNAHLLLPEVAEVLALVHDGKTARGHLELEGLLGGPGNCVPLPRRLGHVTASGTHEQWKLGRLEEVLRPRDRGRQVLALLGAAGRPGATAQRRCSDGRDDRADRPDCEEAAATCRAGGSASLGNGADRGRAEVLARAGCLRARNEGLTGAEGAKEAQPSGTQHGRVAWGRHRGAWRLAVRAG
mmetsp:Transcript_96781/g.301865  ORF Transcript_96781/g.301865 Transcript_96781/m.301865 type:complete len:310 (+) Transcript_96781:126-1055(+)